MVADEIIFDGAVLAAPVTGVGRSLLDTLAAYAPVADHRCVLLVPERCAVEPPAGVEVIEQPRARGARLRATRRWLRQRRVALWHSPTAALPGSLPCPALATIHDLPWQIADLRQEAGSGWRHRIAAGLALRRAAAVLVPSAATAAALAAWQPRATTKVLVARHGIALPAATEGPAQDGRLLVLGDDRPRKNLTRLRAAHRVATQHCPAVPQLEFVGPGFDYVAENDKRARLRQSRALVHVSLLEGFGLPVLEAMAHGVAVVCSDIAALREIAADAALFVDPRSLESICAGLVSICTDAPQRRTLITAGRQRAASLSLAASAQRWHAIHARIIARCT